VTPAPGQYPALPRGPLFTPPPRGGFRGTEDAMTVTASYMDYGLQKIAIEFGGGVAVPGTPFSVGANLKNKDERLPGMSRWVDRDVLERAMQGTDQGLDAQALVDQEMHRGNLMHPLMGAAAAAALTKYKLPGAGNVGALLAALTGAGAGSVYNHVTADSRGKDMMEALRGTYAERGFPLQGAAARNRQRAAAGASCWLVRVGVISDVCEGV
jgi:hypothetical protein